MSICQMEIEVFFHIEGEVHATFNISKEEWLTNYLENVGKQDYLLGGLCSVRPVAKQRSRQEATQAERWQCQTQEVRRCI